MTTSGICARAAIGNSAALAVAPSNTCRRLMVIAISPACPALSMKRLTSAVKPQRTAVAAYESIIRLDRIKSDHALITLFKHDLRANASGVCREGKPFLTFPDHALQHCKLLVAQVRHQHQARRMRDRKRQLRRRDHRLRRH